MTTSFPDRPHPRLVPVVGFLDELIVVPIGVVIAHKMILDEVFAECRRRAREMERKPVSKVAAVVVVGVWLLLLALAVFVGARLVRG